MPSAPDSSPDTTPDPGDVAAAAALVAALADDRAALAQLPDDLRVRLLAACGRLARPDHAERARFNKARRRRVKLERRAEDEAVLGSTRIRALRAELVYPTPGPALGDGSSDDSAGPAVGAENASAPSTAEGAPTGDGPAEASRAATAPLADGGPASATEGASPAGGRRVRDARSCYVCKADYHELHHFYDSMCPTCAAFNWDKRHQTADLRGRVALLTGGRVKIGYHTGIKLLRAGARLVVSTRFPRDAAARYAAEPDFDDWRERLEIFGLDLRHTPSVEGLAAHLAQRYARLDVLVNNACQTVRRPPGFYAHLMQGEQRPLSELPDAARPLLAAHEQLRGEGVLARVVPGGGADDGLAGVALSAALSQLALVAGDDDSSEALFPEGRLDADLQQVDLREVNSWRLPLAEVPTVELLEVHLVNAVAPFVLNARLKPLLLAAPGRDQHVVNVSAMEGQFYRSFKTDKHPHTNMAKAALNMMTRTSAADYARDGIHMNSVDTGWITDEDPAHITERKRDEHGFHPPLDHVDAAARILDPVFDGLNTGVHVWGQFLKDYRPTRW